MKFYRPLKTDMKYPKEISQFISTSLTPGKCKIGSPNESRMVPKEQLNASLNMIEYIFKSSIITDMYNNYYTFVTLIATRQHCFPEQKF